MQLDFVEDWLQMPVNAFCHKFYVFFLKNDKKLSDYKSRPVFLHSVQDSLRSL